MQHAEHGCCHHAGAGADGGAGLRTMQLRFGVCLALTLPLWMMEAIQTAAPGDGKWRLLRAILGTAVVVWGAGPFFRQGWRALNMFTLVSVSIGTAWLLSAVLEVAARADGSAPEVYFETAATITVWVLAGQVLEQRAQRATRTQLGDLYGLLPKHACRVGADGSDEAVTLQQVRPGDLLRVRHAERVPVDGVLHAGHANIDASWVTGESMPRACAPGDRVVGGSLNGAAAFVMRAEQVGDATLVAQVQRLVVEAQAGRARVQRLADRVSAWFVPGIILVAAATVLVWWGLGDAGLPAALLRGATVCIVACPCALGLATPVAMTVAVGRAAAKGLVIRRVTALETLAEVDTLVVDKTGTLTEGRPRIATVVAIGAMSRAQIMYFAATLERGSLHPLAHAVADEAAREGIVAGQVEACVATPGVGLSGRVDGHDVQLGKPEALGAQLLLDLGVQQRLQTLQAHGQTLMLLVVDSKPVGILGAADAIRPTTGRALAQLQSEELEIVMLTGDNQAAALMVADTLNIREVHADMLPQDKMRHVQALQAAGRKVAMAGDGINDAPALAQADVGLAISRDAHIAMPQAGINLLHPDLLGICEARRLSVATLRVVRQNLVLAFAYNLLAVPAAGGAPAILGLTLSPSWASVAMGASSLAVVGNALRLRKN